MKIRCQENYLENPDQNMDNTFCNSFIWYYLLSFSTSVHTCILTCDCLSVFSVWRNCGKPSTSCTWSSPRGQRPSTTGWTEPWRTCRTCSSSTALRRSRWFIKLGPNNNYLFIICRCLIDDYWRKKKRCTQSFFCHTEMIFAPRALNTCYNVWGRHIL